ncbi:MAG: alpha-glucuronidase [Prevotella sp.]|uniref:alpha-glucuronidase n=1 Tax=Prevotella sp. PTAC TaxID=2736295 RepID=UPI001554F251|nr:alpha-glucuronidase [Prevotella sp. PTAC]MCX4293655.1 alpha-glucuronidase [Prevotella sp.]NPD54642.1 alpha-glucuronidase [Prevotella sp. PTAC]
MQKKSLLCTISLLLFNLAVMAEDGSKLWMRYKPYNTAKVTIHSKSATAEIAKKELEQYYDGKSVALNIDKSLPTNGSYVISGTQNDKKISAGSDIGLLYGAYALLRNDMTQGVNQPAFGLRILNHWDNLDSSIERGYAGPSIFWNKEMRLDTARIHEYARANASIGINGTVLNNVNASPKMLSRPYLLKVKQIADILRPYGIRVYLSVNFASPMRLGGLRTADPLNTGVRQWWKKKAKEIYREVPDFGGFLVKANSEGQPGPGDYGRSHSDGANMLADAVAPFGGTIIWRSFVYGANHKGEDRVKQAVSEFESCDGKFRKNVILQSKNGPLDFQPREPYAPIFDRMQKTPQIAELQITQEYLGQSNHLVYLAPMWKEFFSFVNPKKLIGIAGVANIGDDANWCGHHFAQANWYAFGRLAWNPDLSSRNIAEEWLEQTFVRDEAILSMMLRSREACVDYMMPLGLHHIFKFDHHYGPEPDGFKADYPLEWCPVYYHQADSAGVGFDRSTKGTGATAQYPTPYCTIYDSLTTCPERYLLWFHHVPWTYRTLSGRTLWDEMQYRYNRGVKEVEDFASIWQESKKLIDPQRWQEVNEKLSIQLKDAKEWRDTCLDYFSKFATK